ncbi:PucR family transcriptional regulator [Rhodococcus sp. P1Y]|uniref:PucR family transcriptional regulator n=1 Tax=Rhodococcus sp. P1Y TaxID=1302308 RepID=UPI000EB1AB37|nr:helix-turn-helix domain-containing protein [Rhodococcus sp. P1Y]AYJ50218.1 PucR family transcriptional regulator [Rhodococcus sp. P1Y]
MRLDTSFAHSTTTSHSIDRSSARPGRGNTHALESLSAQVVARCFRADRLPVNGELEPVRLAADDLARSGVALRDAQRAVHVAVSAGLRTSVDGDAGSDGTDVVGNAVFMMRVLEILGNVVSSTYLDHCRQDSGATGERVAQLVDLLASDDPEARAVAERNGIEVAAEYDVVFVRFVESGADGGRSITRTLDAAAVAAAEAALASASSVRGALISLTAAGGTILVPCVESNSVEECVARVGSVLRVGTVSATARAALGAIEGAVTHCRELVDLARSLRMQPRLYRTSDLALEYQLSRPGPGRSRLRSVIAPLDAFPELMHTLRTFVDSEANRRASAKSLYVHPNTVDYRLKRIEQLTGVDPLSSTGLMSLHAALVVDSLEQASVAPISRENVIAEAS